MMSAHDVAVAALNEVASSVHPNADAALPELATESNMDTIPFPINKSMISNNNSFTSNFQDSSLGVDYGSSNNSQITIPEVSTPPTSDGFSSQLQSQGSQPQVSNPAQPNAIVETLKQNQDARVPQLSVATNAGQKRTIDGYVRESGSSSSESPTFGYNGGHSRNASAISAASSSTMSARELTSELRTRLSYAMVKVNKGWESLPIYEVESLASQAGSPTSSTSTINGRRSIFTSPRTAMATKQGGVIELPRSTDATRVPNSHGPITYGEGQPSRTYESFWQEQSQRSTGLAAGISSPGSSSRSLAPSADLSSSRYGAHHRRSQTPRVSKPQSLQHHTTSDLSQSSQSSAATGTPSTPGRTQPSTNDSMIQTPTQKSLQEQDAIETLLFMSSPGNPATLGHTFPPPQGEGSRLQSPLRAEFQTRQQADDVDHFKAGNHHGPRYRRRRRGSGGLDNIDYLLDRAADSESSDDEFEIPLPPRRLPNRPI